MRLYALWLLLLASTTASAQYNWQFSAEKDGIKVYTSIVPESKIKALKVECNFQTTLPQLTAVLMDIKAAPEWVYATKSCVMLKQVSPADLYYYSEVKLPWPVQNRDFVAHLTVSQNPETRVVTVDGPVIAGMVPSKDGIVRVDHSKGKWLLIPISKDEVKIEYILQTDPGGAIPAWIVNLFASEGPMQSFKRLKLQLLKPAYKNVSLAYVRN
ncbi:MAG: START domain-containing protein [Mucilaginibacter sp.]